MKFYEKKGGVMPDIESSLPAEQPYAIIICGNEILLGKRQDLHVSMITRALGPFGFSCIRSEVVGDHFQNMVDSLQRALREVNLIIVTGGLGPTVDDITRECISAAMEIEMYEDPDALEMIRERFRAFGREMRENNRRQAQVPKKGSFIYNFNGTAPGLVFDNEKQVVIALPGPPHELQPMLKNQVLPFLQSRMNVSNQRVTRQIFFCCIGESSVDEVIRKNQHLEPDMDISLLAHLGIVELTLSLKNMQGDTDDRLENFIQIVKRDVGECAFSDGSMTLEQRVGELLRERGQTLTVAESCTGGMLGARITKTPGSSSYFKGGVITYSNEIKESVIGVQSQTLREHGAVSRECAAEMAQGTCRLLRSDWGISITGVAGPGGGSEEKPVGTIWIAIASKDQKVFPFQINLPGDRDSIRSRTCVYALDQMRRILQGLPTYPMKE